MSARTTGCEDLPLADLTSGESASLTSTRLSPETHAAPRARVSSDETVVLQMCRPSPQIPDPRNSSRSAAGSTPTVQVLADRGIPFVIVETQDPPAPIESIADRGIYFTTTGQEEAPAPSKESRPNPIPRRQPRRTTLSSADWSALLGALRDKADRLDLSKFKLETAPTVTEGATQ